MADLEQRVATLEREMTAVKGRVGIVEEEAQSIPDLIKLEFRLHNSQLARLSRDVAQLKGDVEQLQGGQVGLTAKVEALPRAVAELVVELLSERDSKR